jgi:hypothetical protein
MEYIGRKFGTHAKKVHRITSDEIAVMLENKDLEVVFICSFVYSLHEGDRGASR